MDIEKNSWQIDFMNPPAKYRAKPFWSWNGKLNKDIMREQINKFSEMGYGGFHIHARVGLADTYMGKHFLECVDFCNKYAKKKYMETWLYDEDKWPSGFGGGYVTKKEENRNKCLLLSKNRYLDGSYIKNRKQPSRLSENGTTKLLAAYHVKLDENGFLQEYSCVNVDSPKANWFAYRILTEELPWFNESAYADLLNSQATYSLISETHEKYKQLVGEEFGKSIPAIFTDEPQHSMVHTLRESLANEEPVIPYTESMDMDFAEVYGYSLLEHLPEIFWNDSRLVSKVRWQFHDWLTERFANSYFGVLQNWCQKNNLMLTGHVMRESTLSTQTEFVGETMRLYPKFDLPGLDILADRYEYSTAKQVQSVSHQFGKPGVICELYGVTNWDFDFKGHKRQADWLMALGTNVRVPHLAWMYMGGESKRDYPAALDGHSPWYYRYSVVEDYLARVSVALTRGQAKVRVAVIHPIESYWSVYGPDDQTGNIRNKLETEFKQLIEWILFGQIDFDFMAESLLLEQTIDYNAGELKVGQMKYEAVVVPPLVTIRRNTLKILNQFAKQGGKVIWMGEYPEYVDAEETDSLEFFNCGINIGFDQRALLKELEPMRDVKIVQPNGATIDHLIYQLREDKEEGWLFVAAGRKADNSHMKTFFREDNGIPHIKIGVRGRYSAENCDAMKGKIKGIPTTIEKDWTWISVPFYEHDSVLLHLMPESDSKIPSKNLDEQERLEYLPSLVSYHIHEDNVLLLDMPEYRLDGGMWRKREEILRLDNFIRQEVGFPKRRDAFPQPWLSGNDNPTDHLVELRYIIESKIDIESVDLAYESDAEIFWNGKQIKDQKDRFYLDRAIHRVTLDAIRSGKNELLLKIPFGPKTNLEACYLLGMFGVEVKGDYTILSELPEKIGFGDIAMQGFPFYGGNISYHLEFECQEEGIFSVCIPRFQAPLVDVVIDNGEKHPIFIKPYQTEFERFTKGKHALEVISYGNRVNQFGQVHNCSDGEIYYGPNSWRTEAEEWSYAYQLRPMGIVSTPFIRQKIAR